MKSLKPRLSVTAAVTRLAVTRLAVTATLFGSIAGAGTLVAQTVPDDGALPATGLDLPANGALLAKSDPNFRKATAIVNGDIITGSEVDQRLALILSTNESKPAPEEVERLRTQILRNLIDETLQIQEAAANDITIADAEIDQTFARVAAQNFRRGDAAAFSRHLTSIGSSAATLKRQIRGELAWSRVLRRKVAPFVNVSEDEVNALIARLNAQKGTVEWRLGEIYLTASPETQPQVIANADKIIEQLKQGASFVAYARQFSEASTAAVGGDLGWIRPAQLPPSLAAEAERLQIGQLAGPIPAPGGVSIIYKIDQRQVLTADPRDAVLSLKQIAIDFPTTQSEAQLRPVVARFAEATRTIAGCGQADAVAATLGATVVSRDNIRMGDLPAPLQQVMAQLQIGQATPPYGSPTEGVRTFVLCGRDDPKEAAGPSFDQVMDQITDERVGKRAQLYLRDLRRDAIIEYN